VELYHFNWLSGDQTAQQLIHSIDKSSWRSGQTAAPGVWPGWTPDHARPQSGDQFDHQAVVFEYDNGVRVFGFTRDQNDCYRDTNDYIFGTRAGAICSATASKAKPTGVMTSRVRYV